jgi:transposase
MTRTPGISLAFRDKNASKLKVLFWDGNGLCLFTKRLDHGEFICQDLAGSEPP